ncbi:MAG: hypothetical protein DRQ47_05455 [Gammaproteobacteria bacterium]|nr:MAG: hypothetical protein DRQ47_05455 [Gammaproteobacteria bacterium]
MLLQEYISPAQSHIITEASSDGKNMYMNGIFIQGDVRNANERVYPVNEITNAVNTLNEQIAGGYSVLGEADHPEDLKINLDRVSHMITEMRMEGPNGLGKLKMLPTPMGKLIETMLQAGVKLGVSSRGSGNVNESNGDVSDFEIITVDVVSQPSGPSCYPKPIYESIMNMNHGHKSIDLARETFRDPTARKYIKSEVMKVIRDLKL